MFRQIPLQCVIEYEKIVDNSQSINEIDEYLWELHKDERSHYINLMYIIKNDWYALQRKAFVEQNPKAKQLVREISDADKKGYCELYKAIRMLGLLFITNEAFAGYMKETARWYKNSVNIGTADVKIVEKEYTSNVVVVVREPRGRSSSI